MQWRKTRVEDSANGGGGGGSKNSGEGFRQIIGAFGEKGPIPEDPPKIPEEERKGKGREKTKTFSRTSVLLGKTFSNFPINPVGPNSQPKKVV